MAICYELERGVAQQRTTPEGLRVAAVFKELRAEAGLTQEDVARRVKLTLSGYRPYEQGRRQLRVEQLQMFADAFEVSRSTLSARLGIGASALREVRLAECAELIDALDDQPPEVAETVMRWFRESITILSQRRQEKEN